MTIKWLASHIVSTGSGWTDVRYPSGSLVNTEAPKWLVKPLDIVRIDTNCQQPHICDVVGISTAGAAFSIWNFTVGNAPLLDFSNGLLVPQDSFFEFSLGKVYDGLGLEISSRYMFSACVQNLSSVNPGAICFMFGRRYDAKSGAV